jgi:dipeptidyl-peptidase-4
MRRTVSFAPLCFFLLFLVNCALQSEVVQTPPPASRQTIERAEGQAREIPALREAMRAGVTSNTKWSKDGKFLYVSIQDQRYRFDLVQGERSAIQPDAEPKDSQSTPPDQTIDKTGGQGGNPAPGQKPRPLAPSRGRQHLTEDSPDGRWRAVCRDWNVLIEDLKSSRTLPVTSGGDRKFRYGTANWVYGEELYVYNGMWWSGDSKKLVYYVFDERPVRDFYMLDGLTKAHTSVLTEGFMTAGEANPIVTLALYDRATSASTPVDCGPGDQYLYNMRLTPDGKELLISRTDRRHKQLDVLALDFATGKTRVVVTEKQDSWQENAPAMRFLRDGKRFIWETEKTLWKQYELRNLDGSLVCPLTRGEYPALEIVRVDEEGGCSTTQPTARKIRCRPSCTGCASTAPTSSV